jgi:hypothetical protein
MAEVRVLDRQAIFDVVNRIKEITPSKILQQCNTRPCAEVALQGLLSEGTGRYMLSSRFTAPDPYPTSRPSVSLSHDDLTQFVESPALDKPNACVK